MPAREQPLRAGAAARSPRRRGGRRHTRRGSAPSDPRRVRRRCETSGDAERRCADAVWAGACPPDADARALRARRAFLLAHVARGRARARPRLRRGRVQRGAARGRRAADRASTSRAEALRRARERVPGLDAAAVAPTASRCRVEDGARRRRLGGRGASSTSPTSRRGCRRCAASLRPRGTLLLTTPHHGPLHAAARSRSARGASPRTSSRAPTTCASSRRARCARCSTTSASTSRELRVRRRARRSSLRARPRRVAPDARPARHDVRAARAQRHRRLPRARSRAALRAEGVDVVEAANERRRAPAGGGPGSARNLARDAWWTQVELPRRARAARRRRPAPPAARARRARAVPAGRHGPRPRLRAPARAASTRPSGAARR